MSSQLPPSFDDLYEYYDPSADPVPQPPREAQTPVSQRRAPSASSDSARSLRRTPRLQERNSSQRSAGLPRQVRRERSQLGGRDRQELFAQPYLARADLPLYDAESIAPHTFRRIVSQESRWAPPNTRISRRSHEAILFALEAIRTGDGKNYKVLSADLEEEGARMSDLLSGDQPNVSNGNGRPPNGGSRAARGAPTPTGGVRTPTEVMRARRARDARKKEQEEEAARLQNLEQEELVRLQQVAATGVRGDPPAGREPRRSVGEVQDATRRASGGQPSSRRSEIVPPLVGVTPRPRVTTIDQGQPRPVTQPPRVSSKFQQQPAEETASGPSRASRVNPQTTNIEESANPRAQPQAAAQVPPQPSTQAQTGRSSFPNAFERWETLSSHWEGLTSYWIRRLQDNSNELNREPLNQQMSRQIVDLSAAGSNLFLAVFELQRLRASSDRKFQRWFFETRSELERYQGQQAELERLLRVEREERARVVSSTGSAEVERLKAEELVREMRRELQISKEEARRAWEELGRREQEERDRTVSLRSGEPTLVGGVQVVPMTQGVPSRQTANAQTRPQTRDGPYAGGPTAGMISGQNQRPPSASHTTLESPDEEERQFSYQPPAPISPTDTDPFTEEAARAATLQTPTRVPEPSRPSRPSREELQFYQRPAPAITSSTATTSSRAAQLQMYPAIPTSGDPRAGYSPARQTTTATSNGSGNGRYYPQAGTNAGPQPSLSAGTAPSSMMTPARPGTRNTDPSSLGEPSYVHSNASGNDSSGGDEEYEIDPDGNYRRDAGGRRVPWRDPTDPARGRQYDGDDGSEDEYDVQSDIEREREHARRYGAGGVRQMQEQQPQQQPQPQQQQSQYLTPGMIAGPVATSLAPPSVIRPTTSSPSYAQTSQPSAASSPTADYSGQGYGGGNGNGNGGGVGSGWESLNRRHQHPTPLSAIIEQDDERSRRTSPNPSRASFVSGAPSSEPGSAGVGVQQGSARETREMRERFGGGMSAR